MNVTRHAEIRMQQRAIPNLMVSLVEQYGTSSRCPGGVASIQLCKKQQKKLFKDLKSIIQHYDSLQNVYVVKSQEDTLITVAHSYKRHKT